MEISVSAIADLRETLEREIGLENTNKMSDGDLAHVGLLLLEAFKQGLKRRGVLTQGVAPAMSF